MHPRISQRSFRALENIFFMPFSWMVEISPQKRLGARKAGISAQDFRLGIGILEDIE